MHENHTTSVYITGITHKCNGNNVQYEFGLHQTFNNSVVARLVLNYMRNVYTEICFKVQNRLRQGQEQVQFTKLQPELGLCPKEAENILLGL